LRKSIRKFSIASIVLLVIMVIVFFALYLNNKGDNEQVLSGSMHGKIADYPFDVAVKKADLIVEVTILDVVKEISEPIAQTIYSAKINDTFKNRNVLEGI
jgi:hypothetical protein